MAAMQPPNGPDRPATKSLRSWRIWRLLFPKFGVACLLSLTVLLLFVVWIWIDRSFRWLPPIVIDDLRLQFLRVALLRSMHGWNVLGPRLIVFAILAALGLASTVIVLIRLVIGAESGRTIRSMLLATALLALWLSLFMSYDRLWLYAFRHHILQHHDAMKASVTALTADWPKWSVDLPGLGRYLSDDRDTTLLYRVDPDGVNAPFLFNERFDRITRTVDGDISFGVESSPDWWVHHLGNGRVPKSYSTTEMCTKFLVDLKQVEDLGDGWYLARYDVVEDPSATAQ